MTEKELLKKVKKKDRNAQRMLYQQFQRIWFSICLRYQSQRSDAEDVLQNSLVKIFTKITQFDSSKGNFQSWSSKIVVNENLMFIRKRVQSFKENELSEDLLVIDQSEDALDSLSAKELSELINKLPAGYKAVFNLYVIDGYSHQEIGEQLNISIGTSKSQLFKARKLLQQKLEQLI